MTAREEQVNAAAAALERGKTTAEQYMQAAAATPGVGLQVALPSVPDSFGRPVQGEGYNVPPTAAALRPSPQPAPQPIYADPIVGGALHLGLERGGTGLLDGDGSQWPASRSASRSTSDAIVYAGIGDTSEEDAFYADKLAQQTGRPKADTPPTADPPQPAQPTRKPGRLANTLRWLLGR